MKKFDEKSFEYWEKILESEGLGDFDKIENFSEKILNILNFNNEKEFEKFILDFENKNNLRVVIQENLGEIEFIDNKTGARIGFIKKGNYSYNGLEKSDHLEKVIEPHFRGKGYGKILVEIFKNYGKIKKLDNFSLPRKEYSHKLSTISLLVKYFGYEISAKYIDGEKIEVDDYEFDRILARNEEELEYTYELKNTLK